MSERTDINNREDKQLKLPILEKNIIDAHCYPNTDIKKVIDALRPVIVGNIYWDRYLKGVKYTKNDPMITFLKSVEIDGSVGFIHILAEDDTI